MVAKAYLNGNEIYYDLDLEKWFYIDGSKTDKIRPCPKCNKLPDENGHDACLSKLPGVKNACCGHGVEDGYIMFENGITIRFKLLNIEKNESD